MCSLLGCCNVGINAGSSQTATAAVVTCNRWCVSSPGWCFMSLGCFNPPPVTAAGERGLFLAIGCGTQVQLWLKHSPTPVVASCCVACTHLADAQLVSSRQLYVRSHTASKQVLWSTGVADLLLRAPVQGWPPFLPCPSLLNMF